MINPQVNTKAEILWTTLFIAVVLKHWRGLKHATNLVGTMLNQYDIF